MTVMVKFCPKCGGIMLNKGRSTVKCISCGYEEVVGESGSSVRIVRRNKKKEIVVIEEEPQVRLLPKTNITCPRCGFNEAYYWEIQTRSADEPATRFFKCVKCGYSWREYD